MLILMSTLFYKDTEVGTIQNEFEDQGTWFGDFTMAEAAAADPGCARILGFIDFCSDWFAGCQSSGGGDAAEFNRWPDMVGASLWTIVADSGVRVALADAPMFSGGRQGDVSWILPRNAEESNHALEDNGSGRSR
jgi:hypothetical protein